MAQVADEQPQTPAHPPHVPHRPPPLLPPCTNGIKAPERVFVRRLPRTLEISISKIFAGAFSWQGFAFLAAANGLPADSPSFALITGCGDAIGVFFGHLILSVLTVACCSTCFANRWGLDEVGRGAFVGLWLASCSMLSGTLWQPLVNWTHPLGFERAALLTGLCCGLSFIAALRLGRDFYGTLLGCGHSVPRGERDNFRADVCLGVSIMGALALFCATDPTLEGNWARAAFGVTDADTKAAGMVKAGGSAAVGYLVIQLLQNALLPRGWSYLD